ncbi:uncharacterized protein LOC128240236 isoform X1 [Mya arenaria]|uniref:uncharacterized protein LOC128240236 isoform X1 n=1 Tax=Mya arenaria TaxID=6604 RepID=UPI0022E7F925|nr:uncharacterized protein LOC128240236 isoform X1 [Mya arenaria]
MRVDETAGREWTTKSDKTVQNGILPSASGNARQSENKTANDEDEISARSKNIAGDRLNDATSDKHNPSFNQGAENSKTVSNKSTTLDIFSEVNDKNGSENSIILPDINKSASLDGASTACRTMDAVYEGASPSGRIISTDPNGVSTSGRTMDTVLLQQRIDRYEQKDPATSEVDPGSLAEEMTIALSRLSSPVDGPSKPVALDLPPQKLQLPGDIGEQKTSPPSLPVQVGKTHPSRQIVVADTGKQEKQPGQEPADNRVKEGQRTDRRKAVTTRKVKITLDKKKSASKQYKTDDMSFLDLSPRSYHGAWRTVGRGGGGDRKGRLVDNHVKKHALYHARFAAAPDRRQAFYHARYYYYSSNLIYSRYRISRVFMRKEKAGLHLMRPETNYIRLCLACVEVGTELLRDAFRRFLGSMQPYQTFEFFLAANRKKITGYASTERIISSRWKTIYPETGVEVQLEQLDHVLLFWLLRHMCRYRRVNDVIWRWKAAKSDTSEVADVTRIRDLRNFLLDIKERTLFEDEYKRKIDDFKKVTKRLASESSIKERLDRLDALQKKEPEVSDTEKLVLLLKGWASELGDRNIGKIAPLKQAWDVVNETKEFTRRFMSRHRKPKLFVKFRSYEAVAETIEKHGVVVIVGNSGEGKTTAAVALLASRWDADEAVVLTDPSKLGFLDTRTAASLFVDDMFGSMYLLEQDLRSWEPKFEQMWSCASQARAGKRAYIVITMRKHVYDQCVQTLAKYKLFHKDHIVEFNSKDLTSADMRQMLSYHILVDSQVRAEIYRNAHLHTGSLGFPQCCALYVSQRRLHDMWAHFFEHPIDVLEGDLETLHRSDIHAYFALVVMMFQPGARLYAKKLRDLQDETFLQQLQSLAEVCKVPITEKLPEQLLTSLSGQLTPYVYWEKNIDCYTFSHESVMELMMSSFVKRHPQHVLETCELQFLLDYVFTEENLLKSRNQVFAMRISPDHFWLLSQSIDHYINYGHVVAMATHRVLRDPGFREFFFTYLEKRGESEHIVLAEDSSVKEGVSRRPVGLMFSSINQDKPNVGLVRALWKTGLYQKHSSPWVAGELRSSLLMAVRRGSLEVLRLLADGGIEIPPCLMAESDYLGRIDIVKELLKREKWSQEQLDVALVRAARVQSAGVDVVKLLLGAGASPTSIRASSTALCEAAKADNVKTVQHLLSCGEPGCGSSVTERDLAEGTPLHHACDAGHMDVIQILLKRDASVNAPDEQGMTPFLVAVGWGREEVLQTLLTKKVNPLHVDDHKNNMLHICGATGHDVVMKILVKNFPDVIQKLAIARNVYGWTPLDFSFRLGHLQVTKILVAQVLKVSTPRSLASLSDSKTFVHTRFSIARREEFDFLEPSTCRFVWASGQNAVYRVPRCRWHIEAAVPEEYEETRKFVAKHEEKLRWCLAKT